MAKDCESTQKKRLIAVLFCLEEPSSSGYLALTLWDALHLNVKNSGEGLSGRG